MLKLYTVFFFVLQIQNSLSDAPPLSIFLPSSSRQIPARDQLSRDGRSLVNVFPFNAHGHNHNGRQHTGDHHDHGHHGGHHAHHDDHHAVHRNHHQDQQAYGALGLVRQNEVVDIGAVGQAAKEGERCVEKVMMVEEVVYQEEIECHHSYDEECHTTYATVFKPQQKEECKEHFVKNCYIEYKTKARDELIEICNEKLARDCNKPGPEVCETVYESECETSYHVHEVEDEVANCWTMNVTKCHDVTVGYTTTQKCDIWPKQRCDLATKPVKKYSPETACKQVPRQVCGPGPCPLEKVEPVCRQETKTITQDVPEETCELSPQKVCQFVTIMIPRLEPKEECVQVPKEICARQKRNPRTIKKPVIKKWCYVPSEEAGLGVTTQTPTTTTTTQQPPQTSDDLTPVEVSEDDLSEYDLVEDVAAA